MSLTAESLSVKLSASGGRAVSRQIGKVRSALNSATDNARRAGRAVSDTGGEMLQAATKARTAAGQVDNLSDQFRQLAASASAATAAVGAAGAASALSAMSTAAGVGGAATSLTALGAAAVPLVSTLGAVGAGAAGVASGFGAVIATGAAAYGQRLAKTHKQEVAALQQKLRATKRAANADGELTAAERKEIDALQKSIKETKKKTTAMGALRAELDPAKQAIRENAMAMGQQFVPMIRRAIDALPQLINRMFDAVGSLTPFRKALVDLGTTAMQVLPRVVGFVMDLGREALPYARRFGQYLMANVGPALESMGAAARKALPYVIDFGKSFLSLLGPLQRFGTVVLSVLLPALSSLMDMARRAFVEFTGLSGEAQRLTAKLALLAGPVGLLISRFNAFGLLLTPIGGAIAAVGTAAVAVRQDFLGLGRAASIVWSALQNEVSATVNMLGEFGSAVKYALGISEGAFGRLGNTARRVLTSTIIGGARLAAQAIRTFGTTARKYIDMATLALVQHGPAVRKRLVASYRDASRAVSSALAGIRGAWGRLTTNVRALVSRHGTTVQNALNRYYRAGVRTARTALTGLRGAWSSVTTSVQQFIRRHGGTVRTTLSSTYRQAVSRSQSALSGLRNAWNTVMGRVRALINKHGPQVRQRLSRAYQQASAGARRALGVLRTRVSQALGRVEQVWNRHGGAVKRALGDLAQFIRQNPAQALAYVASTAVPVPLGTIVRAFKTNFGQVKRTVKQAFRTVKTASKTGFSVLSRSAQELKRIPSIARNAFGLLNTVVSQTLNQSLRTVRTVLAQLEGYFRRNRAALTTIWGNLTGLLLGIVQQLTRGLQRLWNKHGNRVLKSVRKTITVLTDLFLTLMGNLVQVLAPVLKRMRMFWDRHGTQITNLVVGLAGVLVSTFRGLVNLLRGILEPALAALKLSWQLFGDETVAIVTFAADAIFSTLGWLIDAITTLTSAYHAAAQGRWTDFLDIILSHWKSTFKGIYNFAAKWLDGLATYVSNTLGDIIGFFQDLSQKLIGGSIVPEMLSSIISAVKNWAISSAFDGVLSGALETVRGIADDITGAVDDALSHVTDVGGDIVGEAQDAMESAQDYLSDARGAADDAAGAAADAASDAADAAGSLVNAVPSGVRNAVPGLASGGYVSGPTLSVIGEGKHPEFVAPRPTMERKMDAIARSAVAAATSNSGGSGGGSSKTVWKGDVIIHAPDGDSGRIRTSLRQELRSHQLTK